MLIRLGYCRIDENAVVKKSLSIVREDNKFIDNENNHACKDLSEVTFCRVKKVADSGSSLLLF